jgi:glycosyltransferase involved in cell wall biosynthesis
MLSLIIFWLFLFVLAVILIHWIGLALFLYCIRRKEWHEPKDTYRPKAAVILALRGGDPFLRRCLEGLLSQNYGQYAVRIVVDHPNDPTLQTVREVLDEHAVNPNAGTKDVKLLIASRHRETCALKCNSLLEAVEQLDADAEIVVTLDADTNPYPTWLAELVEPLSDDRFAAASGMRWYFPPKSNAGTLVRYLWNAAAFVQMYFYKIPWGGSLAIRRELFSQYNLAERWEHSLVDDVLLLSIARQSGKRIAYVTSVLMGNRETCRLVPFFYWVRRQILGVKLYHPAWSAVLGQCLLISLPQVILIALMIGTAGLGKWHEFYQVSGTFVLYWLSVLGAFFPLEQAVRQLMKRIVPEYPSCKMLAAMILAVPLTQAVYTATVLSLFGLKEVDWRGIRYEIRKDKTVRMIEYVPYTQIQNAVLQTDETVSL